MTRRLRASFATPAQGVARDRRGRPELAERQKAFNPCRDPADNHGMRQPLSTSLLIIALCASWFAPSLAGEPDLATQQRARNSFFSWLATPFTWFASAPSPICIDGLCRELRRESGWSRLGYDLRDTGNGVFLEVQGNVQFRSAEIVFADGHLTRLDLAYARRSNGIYELREFDVDREVMRVRLLARAVSDDATLAVRLGRDGVD